MRKYFKTILPITLTVLLVILAGGSYYLLQKKDVTPLSQSSGNDSLEDYYNAAKDLSGAKAQETEVTFLSVGDIMLSRNVVATMNMNGKDGLYPFRQLDSLLSSTDFNFGNLESPFSGSDKQDLDPYTFTFNAPTYAVSGLSQYNFKILNLANNHALNQGLEGIKFTKKYLEQNYLKSFGAGLNADEAWQGQVITTKGVTIGFTGATYGPSSNYLSQLSDTARLKASIEDLKTRSDFVVVAMHAGLEYTRSPVKQQTDFAKAAIDAGADLVIGAHPHWIQPFEQYKGKYIFYSLGNFVFDQSWSRDTKEGLTLKITISKNSVCSPGVDSNSQMPYSPSKQQTVACSDDIQGSRIGAQLKKIELIPVIIENSAPRLANETEIQSILKKIGATTSVITP